MTDPRARACVRAMEAPPPFTRYRIGQTERNYTNPYRGDYAPYPCPRPTALQAQYAAYPERLGLGIYPAGHTVTPAMERDAVNWFRRHLIE